MNNTRNRYQHGSLTIERRKSGLAVWVYRWREEDSQGRFTRRKRIIGSKTDFPTKAAAKRAMDGLRLEINSEANSISILTVDELIAHYRQTELSDGISKTLRTRQVYGYQLEKVISPYWGAYQLRDVRPVAVETWLGKLQVAPGTKGQDKGCHEHPVPTRDAVWLGDGKSYPTCASERHASSGADRSGAS